MPHDKNDEQQKAADLLSDIMGQQLVKSPELAAKQAHLLALLKNHGKLPVVHGPQQALDPEERGKQVRAAKPQSEPPAV